MDETFGELLGQLLYKELRSQKWLADRVGVTAGSVSRWLSDATRPDSPEKVREILRVLRVSDPEERRKLMRAAGYGYTLQAHEPWEENGDALSEVAEAAKPGTRGQANVILAAIRKQWHGLSDWENIPTPPPYSWQSKLLHVMRRIGERIRASYVLWMTVAFALWWLTVALLSPVLAWPHPDSEGRRQACLLLACALLGLPALIALLTKPEREDDFQPADRNTRLRVLFLKLSGAYMGFFAFAGVIIGLTLIGYYVTSRGVSGWLAWLLCGLPLFFGYVAARRIPADRHYLYDGKLGIHRADQLALGAALLFSLFLPWFLFEFHNFFTDRILGGTAILFAVAAIAWYEMRKQRATLR